MTDRELLELAARASGYWLRSERDADFQSDKVWVSTQSLDGVRYWPEWKVFDPLTDDGDALRLAMALRITVEQSLLETQASAYVLVGLKKEHFVSISGKVTREEATRRAIVRAAAEIGKAMQ